MYLGFNYNLEHIMLLLSPPKTRNYKSDKFIVWSFSYIMLFLICHIISFRNGLLRDYMNFGLLNNTRSNTEVHNIVQSNDKQTHTHTHL